MVLGRPPLTAFLRSRLAASALICVVLVLVKETSLALPAVFFVWLVAERRWRPAFLFALPALALAAWLALLYLRTGHVFGNAEFAEYNITYCLAPGPPGRRDLAPDLPALSQARDTGSPQRRS